MNVKSIDERKIQTSVSIRGSVLRQHKELGNNISAICERALFDALLPETKKVVLVQKSCEIDAELDLIESQEKEIKEAEEKAKVQAQAAKELVAVQEAQKRKAREAKREQEVLNHWAVCKEKDHELAVACLAEAESAANATGELDIAQNVLYFRAARLFDVRFKAKGCNGEDLPEFPGGPAGSLQAEGE